MISKSPLPLLLTLLAVLLLPLPGVAQAGKLKVLHAFQETDGDEPTWLLQASDGTLYGVTFRGGSPGLRNGVLYSQLLPNIPQPSASFCWSSREISNFASGC